MTLTFTIPGTPRAWKRAGGNGRRRYEQPEQRRTKARIQNEAIRALRKAHIHDMPWTGPLALHVTAVWPRPIKRPAGVPVEVWERGGEFRRKGRPDGDNVQKLVMDALQGICYTDDAQVALWYGAKCYAAEGAEARVEVVLERLGWDHDR